MQNFNIKEIAKAICVINKHAKNAPELYKIKNAALKKLLLEGYAK